MKRARRCPGPKRLGAILGIALTEFFHAGGEASTEYELMFEILRMQRRLMKDMAALTELVEGLAGAQQNP